MAHPDRSKAVRRVIPFAGGGPPDRRRATPLRLGWKTVVIATTALALGLGLQQLLWQLARPLALLFLAFVIALALAPLVDRLAHRLPRGIAIILIYLVGLVLLAGILWLVIPQLLSQAQEVVDRAVELINQAQEWLTDRRWLNGAVTATVMSGLQQFRDTLASLPLTIISYLFEIVLVIIMSIWWLVALPSLHRFTLSLAPEARREEVGSVLQEMGQAMGGFVRGTAIDMVIFGALLYLGYLVIGLDFPLVLAVLGALFELIPMVGGTLAGIPAVAIGLLNSPSQALLVLVVYIVIQQFETHILLPKVMGTQAELPPILVIFAVLAGAAIGNLLGALVAIPIAAALRVFVLRVAAPWVRQWTGAVGTESRSRIWPGSERRPRG